MSTTYEIEPSTIATAWASSPLGEPQCESTETWERGTELAMPATKPTSLTRHAVVAAALACGIGLGAAFGLAVVDFPDTRPAVMVPHVEAPTGGPAGPAQAAPEEHPAPKPEQLPLPQPIVAGSESAPATTSAPLVEGAPAAAEPPHSGVSAPAVGEPSQPTFVPPAWGNPANTTVTVDIDVPQLPQPEPADPQKPDTTIELVPASDLPALQPQLPPKVALLPPKSRLTANLPNQKPPESTRGVPPTNRTRLNPIAGTGTEDDE
jgi:hypothetical protein